MKVDIAASPYANIYGEIDVPNNLGTVDEIEEFITQHFDEIKWGDPQIDLEEPI